MGGMGSGRGESWRDTTRGREGGCVVPLAKGKALEEPAATARRRVQAAPSTCGDPARWSDASTGPNQSIQYFEQRNGETIEGRDSLT